MIHGAFRFRLEIQGLTAAGFTDVSGLEAETDTETVREGGVNYTVYKLPRGTSYSDITLKRGYVDHDLWAWHQDIVQGKIVRKNCTIFLLDPAGKSVHNWSFSRAYPIKWQGPDFNASSSSIATESLVLTHLGITRN